jgi:Toxin SymE, type I toxin-antitoxin system
MKCRRRFTVSAAGVQSHADEYPRPWLDPMPSLRLRGRWLKQAGFDIGAQVRVSVESGKLVVEVEQSEQLKS